MAKRDEGYVNQSARSTEWTPVVNPSPKYDGVEEKRRWENAVPATPRREGEDICDWLRRVSAAAGGVTGDRELAREREPGADDGEDM